MGIPEFEDDETERRCKLARIIDELAETDKERHGRLTTALALPRVSHKRIAQVVSSWDDYRVSGSLVANHRNSVCACA